MASLFDFAALAFGPQSVIAPLGALTMVANAVVAPMMHGEKLHTHVVKATAVILVGCATTVASASRSNDICDVDALFALYSTPRFMVYVLFLLIIVLGVLLFISRAEKLKKGFGEDSKTYQKVFKFHRISYAGLSGTFGSQSVLFARSVSELVVSTARGGRNFLLYPGTYFVVFMLVFCIVLQLFFLNKGLSRFESLYNVPVFTSTWIVGTVLGGGVFYGEFSQFSVTQAILFPFGIILCVGGVLFLSFGSGDESGHISSINPQRLAEDVETSPSPSPGPDDTSRTPASSSGSLPQFLKESVSKNDGVVIETFDKFR